ncbi:MAG: FMN-binding glutamate synthase family protein [Deltaproteobacteria bacterium]|nr:FMN-binding glutamate synthase family protein [Deltaproteobacteria bacterium]
MSKWRCTICKYEVSGENPPIKCPVCGASSEKFERVESEEDATPAREESIPPLNEYLSEWKRTDYEDEEKFSLIHKLSQRGKSEISPMGTRKPFPNLETILFRGAQFCRFPLNEDEPVKTKTVIGPRAKQPLELEMPFYVSHMSFGALSREAKVALAMGASEVGTATCSGEGGMLPEEREHATRYIYEIGTAGFSYDKEAIGKCDAVEIKFGQAAKPGMGGHLPAEKMTPEIAAIRGLGAGEDFISPNRQPGVSSRDDLKKMVDDLREVSGGRPVGIKFTAGHIEQDLEFVLAAGPDFITIDCRGGATGAAPSFIRDHVCLPPIYAIRRARLYLDKMNSCVTLCVTGGFRDSTDIAKALALGADAVALASASLMAIGCQQYRICNTGGCPVGIATQDPKLRARFSIPASKARFVNFYSVTREELQTLARVNGRSDVHDLDLSDIVTISNEVAQNTDVDYA